MINFTPMARALMMQRVRAARTWRGDGIERHNAAYWHG